MLTTFYLCMIGWFFLFRVQEVPAEEVELHVQLWAAGHHEGLCEAFKEPRDARHAASQVLIFTSHLSSGLRAPGAAGADPAGRQRFDQNSEGVPAHEAHARPQSDHGGPAEVPTMPHWRQAVGHVSVRLGHLDLTCWFAVFSAATPAEK